MQNTYRKAVLGAPPRPTMITTDPLYFRSRSAINLITNKGRQQSGKFRTGELSRKNIGPLNLAARVRPPWGCTVRLHVCDFLHFKMESNLAGLSVCNCRHTGKWCSTINLKPWKYGIHMQTPLSPLAGCGPVGEWTSAWSTTTTRRKYHSLL